MRRSNAYARNAPMTPSTAAKPVIINVRGVVVKSPKLGSTRCFTLVIRVVVLFMNLSHQDGGCFSYLYRSAIYIATCRSRDAAAILVLARGRDRDCWKERGCG